MSALALASLASPSHTSGVLDITGFMVGKPRLTTAKVPCCQSMDAHEMGLLVDPQYPECVRSHGTQRQMQSWLLEYAPIKRGRPNLRLCCKGAAYVHPMSLAARLPRFGGRIAPPPQLRAVRSWWRFLDLKCPNLKMFPRGRRDADPLSYYVVKVG